MNVWSEYTIKNRVCVFFCEMTEQGEVHAKLVRLQVSRESQMGAMQDLKKKLEKLIENDPKSQEIATYEARIKCIELSKQGKSIADIAQMLNRKPKWVENNSKMTTNNIKKPHSQS